VSRPVDTVRNFNTFHRLRCTGGRGARGKPG